MMLVRAIKILIPTADNPNGFCWEMLRNLTALLLKETSSSREQLELTEYLVGINIDDSSHVFSRLNIK